MERYRYRPLFYYGITFLISWGCWAVSACLSRAGDPAYPVWMALGLFVPAVVALLMITASKDKALQREYFLKAVSLRRIRPDTVAAMLLIMPAAVAASILISTFFGQPLSQFRPADGFSFSIGTAPTLLVLFLAAFFEEFGWRGYGMDSLERFNYFAATWIFGFVWALWHLPLFFIVGSYQYNILQENPWYMFNFFVSFFPLTFLLNWLSAKNRGSILAAILFHFFVNVMQEATQMNEIGKCIETPVLAVIALAVVLTERDLFFAKADAADGTG